AELGRRIDARVDAIVAAGAAGEARQAAASGASRTARAALGFDQLLAGDVEGVEAAHRNYARRQLTWMRKMPSIELIDRTGLDDAEVAAAVLDRLDAIE
ncbi:MAG: tRNA (adenosine(37)-N6)-dimethylallyltransferase MiaA, partial [Solirubrobacterales bacterium]